MSENSPTHCFVMSSGGKKISLLANHVQVKVNKSNSYLYNQFKVAARAIVHNIEACVELSGLQRTRLEDKYR